MNIKMVRPGKPAILVGTFVHSKNRQELEFIHNAMVCVDRNGKIVKIETDLGEDIRKKIYEIGVQLGWQDEDVDVHVAVEGEFFFPGFIDTHIHASQYPNAGIFGKTTLLDWLATYTFPLESSLKDLKKARQVYTACVRRTLSHGTTTAAYYATIDVAATNLLADLCLEMGQRAFVGRVCMDDEKLNPDYYRDESAAEALEKSREVVKHIQLVCPSDHDIVRPILTPRFAPSCSKEAMSGLGQLAKEKNLAIQTHLSENKGEIELVKEMFPEQESYTETYDAHGLLTPKTVLAHVIHVSEKEADLIARRGSAVSHCPCSNTSITSGTARVRWLWEKQIDVGLGTDVSGGYSPSILEAARQAAMVSRHVAMGIPDGEEKEKTKLTVEEVLYLATSGGAKCLSLEDRVGRFEVGMDFDAQLISLPILNDNGERRSGEESKGNVDLFGWENWEERMAKWLYNGDDRNTQKVWVKGRLVHEKH